MFLKGDNQLYLEVTTVKVTKSYNVEMYVR